MPRTYTEATSYDSTQGQFTFVTTGNQHYLQIGAVSPRDQRLLDTITSRDFVAFEQNSQRRATANILAAYATNGFEIEAIPSLNIGEAYDILYTRERPPEDLDEAEGWVPVITLVPDGERCVLQVIDWTGGTGTKPPTGQYIGLSTTGYVTDIADAANLCPPPPYSSEIGDPAVQSNFMFTSVQSFRLREGTPEFRDLIEWQQGNPEIPNFTIADITLKFYEDAQATIERSPDFIIPETTDRLGDIIFLDNFIDNLDGTGTLELVIRPNEIDLDTFMQNFTTYYQLSVDQPEP